MATAVTAQLATEGTAASGISAPEGARMATARPSDRAQHIDASGQMEVVLPETRTPEAMAAVHDVPAEAGDWWRRRWRPSRPGPR